LFEYQPTREGTHPRTFLKGFCGYLHVTAMRAMKTCRASTLVGCWSHARRKVHRGDQCAASAARKAGGTPSHVGLAFCDALFKIERDLHEVTPEERFAARAERSAPILAQFSGLARRHGE